MWCCFHCISSKKVISIRLTSPNNNTKLQKYSLLHGRWFSIWCFQNWSEAWTVTEASNGQPRRFQSTLDERGRGEGGAGQQCNLLCIDLKSFRRLLQGLNLTKPFLKLTVPKSLTVYSKHFDYLNAYKRSNFLVLLLKAVVVTLSLDMSLRRRTKHASHHTMFLLRLTQTRPSGTSHVHPPANKANEQSKICVVSRGGNFSKQ